MILDRKIKPVPKGKLNINLPNIELLKTKSGIDVFYVNKPELPIVQFTMMVEAGSKFDPNGKKGLSNLTSMVIDEGAGNYNALQLDEEIESIGTILNISGDHDYIFFSMLSMLEKLDRSLELLSLIIKNPSFTKEDFVKQKNKILTKIIQLKDEPSYISRTMFEKLVFNNSLYQDPVVGYQNDIENISIDDIKEFYQSYFSPGKTKIIAVGNIEKNLLLDKINTCFDDWKNTANIILEKKECKKQNKQIYLIHRENAPQTEIVIGNLATNRKDENYFGKLLLNTVIGGQFTSRININLREDKGYTYGASSSFSYNKLHGVFAVSTSVQSEHTKESVNEILMELAKALEGVSETELEFGKSYLIKKYPSQFETYNQITKNLSILAIHGLSYNYFNTYTQSIENVSNNDIIKAAKQNILNNNLIIMLVGNRDTITEQFGENIIELDLEGNRV